MPVRLRDCQVVNLPMNSMVAGTMLRGMFEDRIQNVIRELKERPNLILFVDEAHTMVGAGSALGAPSDAANIFKSVLARGEIRMVAATTLSEYKEYIQEDEALARRFRCVTVCEPTASRRRGRFSTACGRGSSATTRCACSTRRSKRRSTCRRATCGNLHLPDKVIGWLDTAAVRAEIDRRWEVKKEDVVSVISHVAQIPEDMVFRDVTRSLQGHRSAAAERASSASARRSTRSRGAWC